MKFLPKRGGRVFLLVSSLLFLSHSFVRAQWYYQNEQGSQVKISGLDLQQRGIPYLNFKSGASFEMKNGALNRIDSLQFSLPSPLIPGTGVINKENPSEGAIDFQLTHSMVLPYLNQIHLIGYLSIDGVRSRINFQGDFVENNEETVTIVASTFVNSNDFQKDPDKWIIPDNKAPKIRLDVKLIIKNETNLSQLYPLSKKTS